jgi:hypothetical protein
MSRKKAESSRRARKTDSGGVEVRCEGDRLPIATLPNKDDLAYNSEQQETQSDDASVKAD